MNNKPVIIWEEIMPILDQLTLVSLKIQQLNQKLQPVPGELYDEETNLKDELTEKLVAANYIKFSHITNKL